MDQTRYVTLDGGRKLAYREYGRNHGSPVFYCHGFPGSRLEAELFQAASLALDLRLIAPDRPGYGRSQPMPGRQLLDWPDDLMVLAERLKIEHFHLLGISGGGPYALACAERIGTRLKGVAVVCGLGELLNSDATADMSFLAGHGIDFYRHLPGFSSWTYSHLATPVLKHFPAAAFKVLSGSTLAKDRKVLADLEIREVIEGSFQEALCQGGAVVGEELGIYTRPWGVDLTAIDVPVTLWHGMADTTVPVAMGRRHADLIPGCRPHILPEEGHFSIVVEHAEAILAELMSFN